MQGPGAPKEEESGGFRYGGWIVPYSDEVTDEVVTRQFSQPFDLLLGRTTFVIWAQHWPQQSGGDNPFNKATKYVASNSHFIEVQSQSTPENRRTFQENYESIRMAGRQACGAQHFIR